MNIFVILYSNAIDYPLCEFVIHPQSIVEHLSKQKPRINFCRQKEIRFKFLFTQKIYQQY